MSAFKFNFRKKPLNFSKMKDGLIPDEKKDKEKEPPAAPEPPKKDEKERPKGTTNAEAVSKKADEIKPKADEDKAPEAKEEKKGDAASKLDEVLGLKKSGRRRSFAAKPLTLKRKGSKRGTLILVSLLLLVILIFAIGRRCKPELISGIIDTVKEKIGMKAPGPEQAAAPEAEEVEQLVTVRTYRVARGDFIDMLPGMGTIKGDREVELRFSVSGIVDSINFFEGDLVRKGDIIATLDQKDALLKLEYSKSKLKTQETAELTAKKKLDIHQKLYDEDIIIKPKLEEMQLEYENAQSQTKSAQKEVEFALSELDKTYLYSPIDSVMGTRDVEAGEFLNSNIKVATLYDTETVVVEMGIIEKDISRVALGQNAKVNVDTYPGVDFQGKIDSVAPIVKGKSRTLTAKIRIKNDNPKGTLLPGMFARAWISVYEKKNTIKVPATGTCVYDLDEDGELDSVYVVGEDNIARARAVKIGYISTDYIEITDGLREAEQVISEAMADVKDGVKVDVIEIQEAMF